MASFFKQPRAITQSGLEPEQRALLEELAGFIRPQLNASEGVLAELEAQLLGSNTAESRATSERLFREALLGPALESFDRDIAPSIAGEFAAVGGTLSSRRGQTLARERTSVINNATAQLANLLPEINSAPLNQTLGRIQGLQGLQTARLTPFQSALQFALTPTRSGAQQPGGAGFGLINSAIGATGFILGGSGGNR